MNILNAIDYRLVPFVVNSVIFGYWLKRIDKPKWVPPVPALMFLCNFAVCAVFGWIHSTAAGAKAIIDAIGLYGLGNGLFITLVSTYGYDIFHNYQKQLGRTKAEETEEEEFEGMDYASIARSTTPSRRAVLIKALFYAGVAAVGAIVAVLFAALIAHQGVAYTLAWAIFGSGLAMLIARIVYHIVNGDNSPIVWQITIYASIALAGFTAGIFSQTPSMDFISISIAIAGLAMAAGTRFISIPKKRDAMYRYLMHNLACRFIDDNPMLGVDSSRPFITEAEKKEYIATVFGLKAKEEE